MTKALTKRKPMTDDEAQRLFSRLVLQGVVMVDVPHSQLKGKRLIGFIIEPDEHYQRGEGVAMIEALQFMAGVDVKRTQDKVNDALATTNFDFAAYGGLNA